MMYFVFPITQTPQKRLKAALDENAPLFFIDALGVVAKSQDMKQITEQAGVGYNSLYKSFGTNKHPRFETVYKAIQAIGLRMHLAIKIQTKTASRFL